MTGKWHSNDPIGISGGLNQYVFCGDNPVNFVDPDGLYDETVHFYMTQLWAVQAGINPTSAKAIANLNNFMDVGATDPVWGDRKPHFQNYGDINRRWDIYREAECAAKKHDIVTFGSKLHEFQDTYAHAGYGPKLGHAPNPDSIFSFFFGGSLGPDVYDPSSSRDRAMMMNTQSLLRTWASQNPTR